MDKIIIELPAGLINTGANPGDPDESPKVAALRELEEETGYKADLKDIIDISPIVCADPGMTTAKMALVTVQITLEDEMEHPEPKPDPGEHIRVRVVEIANLSKELKEYSKQPEKYMIDARLAHFASGLDLAGRIKEGGLFS
ncbi:hypothetical protein HYDPIDRAFT_106284 [Hydnomerulius pinastri MD-312]|nr:hypothetical protein HYDPIDRAFT_106284 [Hydnomerulius pinastri MD-312]